MKRILLLAVAVALASPLSAFATDSTPPASTPPAASAAKPTGSALTPDEKKELGKDRMDAMKADPTLAAEQKDIADKMKAAKASGQKPSPELVAQKKAFDQKVNDAVVKADPNAAALLEKQHPVKK